MNSSVRHTKKKANEDSRHFLGDGKIALGATIGAILSIITLQAFQSNFLIEEKGQSNWTIEILTILIALTSLMIAFNALHEQRRTRQAGSDPVILIHLDKREDARILSTLEIRNVGAGAALEVSIKPISNWSIHYPARIITDLGEIHTIKTIPQDHSVSFNFGVGNTLLKEPSVDPIEFEITYSDIDGNFYESRQIIDVQELRWQRADQSMASKQASALENIQKALSKLTRHSELHVVAETQKEFDARIKREREEVKALVKRSKET